MEREGRGGVGLALYKCGSLIVSMALIVLSALGALFARPLLTLVAPGFDAPTMDIAVPVSRLLYLSTFFLGVSSVFGGVLQSLKRFTLYSIAPLIYNVGIIAGTMVAAFADRNVMWVGWGVVLGAFLCFSTDGKYTFGWRISGLV